MPIANQDQLIQALPGQVKPFLKASATSKGAGLFHSLWKVASLPTAGASPATGAGAAPTDATAGAFVFADPTGGQFTYLARFSATMAVIGTLMLVDRLVHTSGLNGTLTTVQTINSTAITRPDALGADTELWLEWYTATGSTAVTATVIYVDQSGASQTTTVSIAASPVAGQMIPVPLVSGGTGVRSVTSVQLSASTLTAGDFGITIIRRVVEATVMLANTGVVLDFAGTGMPRIYDGACLAFMVLCSAATTGQVVGQLNLAQG